MLINLHVKNLALIEDIDVDFKEGLNILTGETGAGKSLIIGSVNIALGAKTGAGVIRNGESYALVELTFTADEKAVGYLRSVEITADEGALITVSRKIMQGHSVSKINGETVSVAILKNVMSYLIDIYGQHEHQSLLYKNNHLKMLDEFAGDSVLQLKNKTSMLYSDYINAKKHLSEFDMDDGERNREIEFCMYEIGEIEDAALVENEDEYIEKKYKKLSNSQKLTEAASKILSEFGNDNGIEEKIFNCIRAADDLSDTDEEMSQIYSQLVDIDSLCSDIKRSVSSYIENIEYDGRAVYETEKRMDLINRLKSKYGNTIEKIHSYMEEKKERLRLLENYSEEKMRAKARLDDALRHYYEAAEELSSERQKKAYIMEREIVSVLKELNFLSADFKIDFKQSDNPAVTGIDDIEFLISTNPGENIKPLAKIVSGGELSRIMLAFKTISAGNGGIDTLIFDEVDSGISGRTAQMLAQKLKFISEEHQVISITHLAQVAAMADAHFIIEKSVRDMKTVTNIHELDYDESVTELTRIIGGVEITDAAREHAAQMKEMAVKQK